MMKDKALTEAERFRALFWEGRVVKVVLTPAYVVCRSIHHNVY